MLEGEFPKYRIVRALLDAGAIERPEAGLYLDALLASSVPAAEVSQQEIWEVLAHNGETTVRNADENRGAGYRELVLERVQNGRMDRGRVLDVLLATLAADLNAHRSAWHTAIWRDLEPTADEREARFDQLATLLGAAARPIVSFAVEELLKTDRPVPAQQLAPALTAKAKKTAKGALRLLDRGPDAAVAAIALGHEAADVQSEALDRLQAWGGAHEALLEHLDLLAATQRPRAEALLGLHLQAEEPAEAVDVGAIPEHIREALNFGGPVPEAPVPGEPVLGTPIAPLETVDELAQALADPEADDLRALDAILRHCGDRTAFDGPLKPFVKRLTELDDHERSLATVAKAWLTGEAPEEAPAYAPAQRVTAAAKRAARGEAGPLLALPTHVGGWIDPRVFAERYAATERHDPWDLAEALLRLAPDGRDEALKAIKVPAQGPVADAARAVKDPGAIQARTVIRSPEKPVHDRLWVEYDKPELSFGPLWLYLWDDEGVWPGEIDPYTWPERRDIACATAITRLGYALEIQTEDYVSDTLEALLDPFQPLAPATLRFTLLALCSGAEREHLVAADLLIAAIEDGRADAPALIGHLRSDLELVLTNRLGPRLAAIARAGPLHRAVIRDTLDGVVDRLEPRPRRTYAALLTVLDELCAQTDTRVVHSRAFLQTLSGSSKAAKAAASLLKREGDPPADEPDLLLAARVRRARRWLTR
jgi:hypothetical protein